tara:strand:- start:3810 stop:4166 length:357 start_codon:yes stop_codon:yes gene_type:complete
MLISHIESEIRPGTFVGSSARCVEQNQASHGPLRTEVARWERNDGEPYFSGQLDMSPLHAGAWTKPNGDFNHASISLHQVTNVDLSNPAKIVVTTAKGEIVIQLFTDSDTLSYEWSQA